MDQYKVLHIIDQRDHEFDFFFEMLIRQGSSGPQIPVIDSVDL